MYSTMNIHDIVSVTVSGRDCRNSGSAPLYCVTEVCFVAKDGSKITISAFSNEPLAINLGVSDES